MVTALHGVETARVDAEAPTMPIARGRPAVDCVIVGRSSLGSAVADMRWVARRASSVMGIARDDDAAVTEAGGGSGGGEGAADYSMETTGDGVVGHGRRVHLLVALRLSKEGGGMKIM